MTPVLDSWAVLAVLRAEPAGPRVKDLIADEDALISSVNLGEVLYWTIRERGHEAASALIGELCELLVVEDPDWQLVRAAARVKAAGGVSYADAFCVATAQRHRAPLYTGDPEILELENDVERVDLRVEPAPPGPRPQPTIAAAPEARRRSEPTP